MRTQEAANRVMNTKHALRVRFGVCLNVPMTESVISIYDALREQYSGDRLMLEALLWARNYMPNAQPGVGQALMLLVACPQIHV